MKRYIVGIVVLVCCSFYRADAQLIDFLSIGSDSACISDQSDKLLLRTFVMQKFNRFRLGQYGIGDKLNYRANDNYNLGFGFHYKWLGINASFQMPFVNNDDGRYGKTRFFDLQSYLYLNKIAIDLFVLSYRGYYLTNSSVLQTPQTDGTLFKRGDLRTGNYGVNAQYIFNHEHFSYRAAFLQNACQMQSAGSLIAGGTLHYTHVKADSAIIPDMREDDFYRGSRFNKTNTIALAVDAGYAYTQVIGRHFFITGSVIAGVGLNYMVMNTDATNARQDKLHSQLHAMVRGAAGYNEPTYFIGVQYTNFIARNNTPIPDAWQQLQAGNIRLTYARRFTLKRKVVKRLERIEDNIRPAILDK